MEEERKAKEEMEMKEVIEANKTLKSSFLGQGRSTTGSKISIHQQSNDGRSSSIKKQPTDTTQHFINTIND